MPTMSGAATAVHGGAAESVMGRYYSSKIGELREVGSIVLCLVTRL